MQMEESARQALEAKSENAIKQGRANPAELECIKKMDLAVVNDVYVAAFTKNLTREEMQQATAFFRGPAGQAYLKYSLDGQFRQEGLPAPKTELSADTTAKVLEFSSTPAGDKLIMKRVHYTADTNREIATGIVPELLECKRLTSP